MEEVAEVGMLAMFAMLLVIMIGGFLELVWLAFTGEGIFPGLQ